MCAIFAISTTERADEPEGFVAKSTGTFSSIDLSSLRNGISSNFSTPPRELLSRARVDFRSLCENTV